MLIVLVTSLTQLCLNKAGYMEIQSRTVGQKQLSEFRLEFKNVMDGPTNQPTN